MKDKVSDSLNTLIIFCDQHNARVSGCYGNKIAHTPNIDMLASRGTLFENAYTTNPICVPARASFATGDYASANEYWDNCHAFAGEQMSWGRRLEEAGVSVTTIGKLHFRDSREETFPGQRIPMNITNGLGDPMTAYRFDHEATSDTTVRQIKTAGEGEADYVRYDRIVAEKAVEYLSNEAPVSKKPWCLYVGFTTPHNPYRVPAEYLDQYRPFSKFKVDPDWHDDSHLHPAMREFRRKKRLDQGLLSDEDIQKATAAYYGMVSFMDDMTGKVLRALKDNGLENTTRIIYMDDHGDMSGRHGLFFKSTMYEESVGIPLVISGPGIPAGKRVKAPVSITDIYPTLLDFYSLSKTDHEKNLPGISLVHTINHGDPERPIYSEYFSVGYDHSVFMLRKGKYKLVYFSGYENVQLFDLQNDPDEKKDLGRLPEYSEVIRDLKTELFKIADPEELDRRSLEAQRRMIEERGGIEKIRSERGSVVPFTPVPAGIL